MSIYIEDMLRETIFLYLSPNVRLKVTVTPKGYATLHDPKLHLHTNFVTPTSNNIGYFDSGTFYNKLLTHVIYANSFFPLP